ncbi:hypothetical protein AUR04nite_34530 [Glutamicibacter uratoxydans]|uniref:Glycosyl hydrolase family 32 N-terminal domain-containing protein n=1 Tax=Glutamicibacter uratoxydans TaxID=43667 RepID=A0A4Y4DZY8_GLUUR|nr:glycoside hydrolase family 32 protein [Glutamicibacter uratoxydans]GED07921.1 hypothetical protein AUR04nite_34530 [Glutamicibacter uratoxydans]
MTSLAGFPRPERHFTPKSNWINDPNGLFFDGLNYHLYFQHNPHGIDHGNMSWGHALSTDLVHWGEQPIAIMHDEAADIFSGSIVVDESNTSGLGDGINAPVVALYTAAATDESNQAQALAYSLDGGTTFTKYQGNPVLDRGSKNFRDPKVFRYGSGESACWVMVTVEAEERKVLIYQSTNLIDWEFASEFGPQAAVDGVWECPDLFPLQVENSDKVRWILLVSLNPGGVAGGSGTQYFIGDFNGATFTPQSRKEQWHSEIFSQIGQDNWLDWGRDFYAGVTFFGLPEERKTLIAWMSNWDYARELPHRGWRGSMSTARQLSLIETEQGLQVRQQFLGTSLENPQAFSFTDAETEIDIAGPTLLNASIVNNAAGPIRLGLRRNDGSLISEVTISQQWLLHRREAGITKHELYPSVQRMPLPVSTDDSLQLQILLDHGSIEILAANGLRSLTDQLVGEAVPSYLSISCASGSTIDITLFEASESEKDLTV